MRTPVSIDSLHEESRRRLEERLQKFGAELVELYQTGHFWVRALVKLPSGDTQRWWNYGNSWRYDGPRKKGKPMENKIIEVRDVGTILSVLFIRLSAESASEKFLLERAGYGRRPDNYILAIDLTHPLRIWLSPFETRMATQGARTFYLAHEEMTRNWENYRHGDVLDVQYVLGETPSPKISERFSYPNRKGE